MIWFDLIWNLWMAASDIWKNGIWSEAYEVGRFTPLTTNLGFLVKRKPDSVDERCILSKHGTAKTDHMCNVPVLA